MYKKFIKVTLIVLGFIFFNFEKTQAQCNNIFQFTAIASPATCNLADGNIAITNVTGGSGNYTFSLLGFVGPTLPSVPPNNHAFSGLAAGTYSFTISDGTCDTTITIAVPITGSITSANAITTPTSCTGNIGAIAITYQPAAVNVVSYTLTSTSATNATGVFNALPAGSYTVILEDAGACTYTINDINIVAPNPITDADIVVTPIQCKDALGSIKVNGVTGGTAPFKYSLDGSTPSSINTFSDLFSGVYTVKVTDNNGCTYSENVQMQGSLTLLTDCSAGKDTTLLYGQNAQLNATKGVGNQFWWESGSTLSDSTLLNPIAFPKTTTTYTFTTKTAEGCTCKDRVTVRIIPLIGIPNTFTPNGDGVNDIWIIQNVQLYDNVELNIYNRWGDKVYYVKGYKTGNEWDGASLPDATYYYVIRFNYPDQTEKFEYTGGITIIR